MERLASRANPGRQWHFTFIETVAGTWVHSRKAPPLSSLFRRGLASLVCVIGPSDVFGTRRVAKEIP